MTEHPVGHVLSGGTVILSIFNVLPTVLTIISTCLIIAWYSTLLYNAWFKKK